MEKDIHLIPFRAAKLIIGYLHNNLTESEHNELDEWVCQSDGNMIIFEQLTEHADEDVFNYDVLKIAMHVLNTTDTDIE